MKPKVLIVMGSDSDLPVMEHAAKVLKDFKIPYDITVSSAHRSPERTVKLTRDAEKKGVEIIIAGAGSAAHLAGVIAAHTTLSHRCPH
jgi:phosphoribosylaminoimidazole carboxylase PurE protein